MISSIHALILTLDEEQHIERCIKSLGRQCASITIIDSGSRDRTAEIARELDATVVHNPFVTHAGQVNFAIQSLADRKGWLFRIDADEILDLDSYQTLAQATAAAARDVNGLLVQRRIYFLGRRIRHGGIEPSWQLRLWRIGTGHCEQRWMDEHVKVAGSVSKSGLIISDINLNSLTWWTAKHNSYASREAIEILSRKRGLIPTSKVPSAGAGIQMKRRRFLKERVYARIPAGIRAILYFLYRYCLRLGFLDGRSGWYFHVLQALWYRTLVDAKVAEIEAHARAKGVSIEEAIVRRTGIEASMPDRR